MNDVFVSECSWVTVVCLNAHTCVSVIKALRLSLPVGEKGALYSARQLIIITAVLYSRLRLYTNYSPAFGTWGMGRGGEGL